MRQVWKSLFLSTCAILTSLAQATELQALPGEHDDFETIRTHNKVYVDKSDYIPALLESENTFMCMCRPARFGKSNFLQMLDSYFRGRKESFAGLAIYEKHDWQTSYPVIHLDFSSMDVNNAENFVVRMNSEIMRIGSEYGVQIHELLPFYPLELQEVDKLPTSHDESKLGQLMRHLTENWTKEKSVVILIDEYDYPRRRNSALHYPHFIISDVAAYIDSFLNRVFFEFERMKRFIRLLFLTCTAKVTYQYPKKNRDTPYSVKDITFENRFSKMIGLTGAELQTHLKSHINAMTTTDQLNETFHTVVQKLRRRYNGYCFARDNTSSQSDCRLFNFHSIMSHLRDKNVDFLWHPGAHAKYNIINNVTTMTEAHEIFNLFSNHSRAVLTIPRTRLENALGTIPEGTNTSDVTSDRISMRAFLVLYGYLTFKAYNEQTDEFIVDFPNDEMRESFQRTVLRFIAGREISTSDFADTCRILMHSMGTFSAENFVKLINEELLKPNVGKNDDLHFYYRFSGNRLAHIFVTCTTITEGLMQSKAFYREIVYRDPTSNGTASDNMQYIQKLICDSLVVKLPRGITYTMKVDVERSAASAMNELLKWIDKENFRNASRSETFHLFGIHFRKEEDLIEDWISITYQDGKLGNITASNPRNVKMFTAYAEYVESYSSLTQ